MYITLHCGGMPFDGASFKENSLGGSESAAYYLAKNLAEKGHKVTLFTNSENSGIYDGVKYQWAGHISEECPLGDQFTFYAENTPTDILIIQRNPDAFRHDWLAKVKLWWCHDLALKRHASRVKNSMWNCDGILAVSDYHRKQIARVYDIDPKCIYVLRNGVDGKMIREAETKEKPKGEIRLMYSSRPERGLEHLVREGGIMEKLAEKDSRFHLYVCMYANAPQHMQDYYRYLWQRCDALPNVTNIGCLTKEELASWMKSGDALVYPTEFEEVSCITAMEAAAAGLPFISSAHGALPETCRGGGVKLISLKDGQADEDRFVKYLLTAANGITKTGRFLSDLRIRQLARAFGTDATNPDYMWEGKAACIESIFNHIRNKVGHLSNIARHYLKMSDIYALDDLSKRYESYPPSLQNEIYQGVENEVAECYGFMHSDNWQEHYDSYYQHEEEKGVNYGPQDLSGQTRYEYVLSKVMELPSGSTVMDYGCAHGHFTNNLAARRPDIKFVGIDIADSNIEIAKSWALPNASFHVGQLNTETGVIISGYNGDHVDMIIAAEVVEHVPNAQALVDGLCGYLRRDGIFMATTPYGPWESAGYRQEWPWRAHVYHLERGDLDDMFGHHPDYAVVVAPFTPGSEGKGSYIWSFRKPKEKSRDIDYNRKHHHTIPQQTLSVCMIAKDAAGSILQTLESVRDICDEVIVCIDETTSDDTEGVVRRFAEESHYNPVVQCYHIRSPLTTGFDEARNESIRHANGDWIMWLDTDEVISYPHRVKKYLRNNPFDGYAVKQHHMSAEPLGVMKTDMPVRLFRNHRDIQFFGRVHEHPETQINQGIGKAILIHDVDIIHSGYTNEEVRRKRFWRNIPLMVRDREDYPDRVLGMFLWLRDLCQMCQYELESNGGRRTQGIENRIKEGIDTYKSIIKTGEVRYILEGLSFYSPLARLSGSTINAAFSFQLKQLGDIADNEVKVYQATFHDQETAKKVMEVLIQENIKGLEFDYL